MAHTRGPASSIFLAGLVAGIMPDTPEVKKQSPDPPASTRVKIGLMEHLPVEDPRGVIHELLPQVAFMPLSGGPRYAARATESQLAQLNELMAQLDRPANKPETELRAFPIRYAKVEELASQLPSLSEDHFGARALRVAVDRRTNSHSCLLRLIPFPLWKRSSARWTWAITARHRSARP